MPASEVTELPDELFLATDRSSPIPIYYQLAQGLEQAIRDGRLAPGARLENEIALAQRVGLSRPTIRRAIQELVDKGLLVRRRGIGTQVVHGQISRSVALTSLYEDLERANQSPTQNVLEHKLVPASRDIAERLGVQEGADVLKLRRLRFAEGIPLAILENYLPAPYNDIAAEALEKHSMYALLQARGVAIAVARQRIGARRALLAESKLLRLGANAALLTMERTAYDKAGLAVEYGSHAYRPDLYSFEITLVGR